jgi:bis(5'-adenosyl)-triphosphatase
MIERVYKATSLNIAIQDGPDAGQSVPHLHVHVIPRSKGDLDHRGGTDAIYDMMDGEEGNIAKYLKERDKGAKAWTGPDAEERKPRSEAEMREEADMLRREMESTERLEQE